METTKCRCSQFAMPFSNTKLRLPRGMQNILYVVSREVLRDQPVNIVRYVSLLLDELLEVRKELGKDPAEEGADMEDRLYNMFYQGKLKKTVKYKGGLPEDGELEEEEEDDDMSFYTGRQGSNIFTPREVKQYKHFLKRTGREDTEALREKFLAKKSQKRKELYAKFELEPDDDDDDILTDIELDDEDDEGVKFRRSQEEAGMQISSNEIRMRKKTPGVGLFQRYFDEDEEDEEEDSKRGPKEEDEEIDIDLDDPAVAEAAVKIQAGFKGYMVRKQKDEGTPPPTRQATVKSASQEEEEIDIDLDDPAVEDAAVKIQAGFKGYKARKEMKDKPPESVPEPQEEEEEIDIDLNDPAVEEAAVKIQAGFKGFKARQEIKEKEEYKGYILRKEIMQDMQEKSEDAIDIDLKDPAVEDAAVKIQAGFKGFKARKELKAEAEGQEVEGQAEEPQPTEGVIDSDLTGPAAEKPQPTEEVIDIDLTDPAVEDAAFKIQAGFKGFKARKEFKSDHVSDTETGPPLEMQPGVGVVETRHETTVVQEGIDTETEPPLGMQPGVEVVETRHETTVVQEEIDIDLNDPAVEDAAFKIQAGFKGFKARKEKAETHDETDNHPSPGRDENQSRYQYQERRIRFSLEPALVMGSPSSEEEYDSEIDLVQSDLISDEYQIVTSPSESSEYVTDTDTTEGR